MTLFLIEMDSLDTRKRHLVTEEQLEEMTAEFEAFDGIILETVED